MHANVVESEEQLAQIVRDARTVVVLGAKDETDPDAPAFTVPRAMQRRGVRIIPVNPKLQSALGETAYPSLAAVPDRADIVDVFRRSDAIPQIADEVLHRPKSGLRFLDADWGPPRQRPPESCRRGHLGRPGSLSRSTRPCRAR
jgi:predicted CoA-binding protein